MVIQKYGKGIIMNISFVMNDHIKTYRITLSIILQIGIRINFSVHYRKFMKNKSASFKILFMHLFNKVLYLFHSALINQVSVVGFAGGDFVVDGGEHNFFDFFEVVGLS